MREVVTGKIQYLTRLFIECKSRADIWLASDGSAMHSSGAGHWERGRKPHMKLVLVRLSLSWKQAEFKEGNLKILRK